MAPQYWIDTNKIWAHKILSQKLDFKKGFVILRYFVRSINKYFLASLYPVSFESFNFRNLSSRLFKIKDFFTLPKRDILNLFFYRKDTEPFYHPFFCWFAT